ncbi:MAG: universal stress protein [Hyphomicrobiales bacterium]|nr:universal stress protein [Hyphomicrobiales bacterium]
MGFKDIMVVLERAADAEPLSEFVHSLAEGFGAHSTVVGVVQQLPPAPAFMGEFPYELVQSAQAAAMKEIAQGYAVFEKAAPRAGSCDLVKVEPAAGAAPHAIARIARNFDLTVVVQPEGPDQSASGLLIEGVLFHSGRPLLALPYIHRGPAKLGRVIVAWDGGAAAARAVSCAMPILKRAGRVEVVTMINGQRATTDLPGFDITRNLARHGISAELKTLPRGDDVGALILSYAADENADMLIMGGYGHSRLREFVLGGATRTILASMTLPVFIAH